MVLSEDGEEGVLQRYEELCLDLNMDGSTKEDAWQNYQKILTNFSLEGDQIHWLACSLYESCRRTTVPTVGRGRVEGNCVSLTRLLRSSKFSLIQFFNKMRKWSDMAALPKAFRDKIDKLQRNFAVSTVIFKKYEPIFLDIFVHPAQEPPRQPRGRKQRVFGLGRRKRTKNGSHTVEVEGRLPCTSNDIFKFAWTMFVQVKGNFPAISDDLVNSYHLLLCCVDWIYANAILGGRKDLLNPDFAGLPEDFHRPDWKPDASPPCIMQLLCETHDGLIVEAKTIKEHWWKPHIKRLFEKKLLKGKCETLSAILEIGSFEENVKMTNNFYEEYVLSVGDFDERIFLGDDAEEEIGTPGGPSNAAALTEQMQAKRSLKQHFDETKSLTPSTPLTGRRYLKEKDLSVTPVSTATQSVSRLQALLSGTKTSPSDNLKDIFKSCSQDPTDDIIKRVKEMGELFCQHYIKSTKNDPGAHIDFARRRLQLAESLYYKTLEEVTDGEKRRLEGKSNDHQKVDLLALLENDNFHRSLFACCLEIVIFSYNSQRIFPWIVDIFELSPYQFYKVIEIIIRAEKGLSRDVVKHLNHIEESILESYAWRSDSPLWEAIKEKSIPKCGEVMPAHHLDAHIVIPLKSHHTGTTPQHPRLRSLVADVKPNSKAEPLLSPGPPYAADRFNSPSPGNAKRRLFASGPSVSTLPFSQPGGSVIATTLAANNTTTAATAVTTVSGKNSGQAPTITVITSTYQGGPSAQQGKPSVKSILRSQLKGGIADTLLVSNKLASQLAPTVNDNTSASSPSSSQPDQDSSTNDSNDSGISAPSAASSSSASSIHNDNTAASTAVGTTGSTTTSTTASNNSNSSSRPQQAIVAVMEDGRQILIPVQISQPSGDDTPMETDANQLSNTDHAPEGMEDCKSEHDGTRAHTNPKAEMRADHTYMMPKKTGSLSLFFRKVYHLASVRLRDLCEKLDLEDIDLIQKIWTCFEHGLVNHIHLMCDRHLDQLIMCSLYLIAKVTDKDLTFQNIMKCYRLQPQAQSHVYRSVLLQDRQRHSSGSSDGSSKSNSNSGTSSPVNLDAKTESKDKEKKLVRSSSTLPGPRPSSQPPTPTQQSGPGSSFDFEGVAERGDLIMFYNLVFLKKIRYFALQFSDKPGDQSNTPKISPMPAVRCVSAPSRRVSNQHSIYLWPHQGSALSPSSKGLSYCINRSPSKDLQAINKMIRQVTWSSKRVLEVDRDRDNLQSPAKRPVPAGGATSIWMKRIQDLQGSMDGDSQH